MMPSMPSGFASRDEILEFCNKVREAGEGDVLDALLPGRPTVEHSCLIAVNLNFSCAVKPLLNYEGWEEGEVKPLPNYYPRIKDAEGNDVWGMFDVPLEVLENISTATGCEVRTVEGWEFVGRTGANRRIRTSAEQVLVLPPRIGNAAEAFDHGVEEFAGLTLEEE
jgi:hypothetical protein